MVFSGTRFSAEAKFVHPVISSSAIDFAWLNAIAGRRSAPGNSQTSICGATVDAGAIQDFFHPQLTILTVDSSQRFWPSASCHSRHSATVLMARLHVAGPVCGYVPERRLCNIFHGQLPPEAWRDRTIR